jgi:hypothetical protein
MYEDEKELFLKIHGYPLDLENPKTFNEKLVCKKLFDRNPLIPLTADKYRARQYIKDKIGWEAENHLIPLLYVTDNPETIPFDKLPMEYIIKPNNAAGRWILAEGIDGLKKYDINYIHKERLNLSKEEIINECKKWFKTVHGQEWYEWAYSQIDPLIIIEKLLKEENGNLPSDYRFAMFNGECKFMYITSPRLKTFNYYDANWNALDIKREGHAVAPLIDKPKRFNKMIEFAKKLSKPFDFVRIDFYLVDDYIYFGEITHYPGSGHAKFPKEIDLQFGSYWEIK